jgi:diadenosine tetraphosphate (Ap4A) HIT family hydrolase
VVGSINDLEHPERGKFLSDMVAIGDALLAVTGAYRINYEILGNSDQALHAHIFARYRTEDAERLKTPVWMYDAALRNTECFDPVAHADLRLALSACLKGCGLLV